MIDPHQVNTIICTPICEFFAQHPDAKIGIEEAKLLAKQIAEALKEAGLQIAATDPASAPT
jgi:predicted ATPase